MAGIDGLAIATAGYWVTPEGTRVKLVSALATLFDRAVLWLSSVDGVGHVYDHKPLADDQLEAISLYTVPGETEDSESRTKHKPNVWFITWRNASEVPETGFDNAITYTLQIEGFWGTSAPNGSRVFADLVNNICAEFRKYPNADLAEMHASSIAAPLQVEELNQVMFIKRYFCEHAVLTWNVTQDVTWATT